MEYYDGGPLRHMGDLPAMGADRYGDKTAVAQADDAVSYGDLDDEARQIASVLVDHGVEPDDRVGLLIPNTTLFPVAYFGAIKAGAVPVPLNLRMAPETLVYVLQDSAADHVVASPMLADEAQQLAGAAGIGTVFIPGGGEGAEDLSALMADGDAGFESVPRAFDDVACQPYTSGTTGRPKGVLLTHENLLTTIESYSRGAIAIDPDDSLLLVLPLFHIYALNALMGTYLYSGAELFLQPEPDPVAMLSAIGEQGITKFAGVPAMYTMMFREFRENGDDYDLSTLQDVTCAAAPLADDTRKKIEQDWNVPMVEGWGMTESSPAGTLEPSRGVRKQAGCIGPPVPGIEMKLVDPQTRDTIVSPEDLSPAGMAFSEIDFDDTDAVIGEIAIRGPQVFAGYYNLPEKTAAVFDDDGWFYTKDIARVDADGYYWMVDRADDMIIVGGENIYPAEVENALYAHPAVAEAAVVAAPHEVKGEAPVAFVVLEADAAVDEAELRTFTLDHVAAYAHPRRIFFVDELPRSATQKVQRFKLEESIDEYLDGPLTSSEEL